MSALFLLCLTVLPACGKDAPAAHPTTVPLSGTAGAVSFLAMGDWGTGGDKQKAVAEALAKYSVKKGNVQAMVLAGDNFYMDLSGIDDPTFQNVFEKMYDPKRMGFPFFAVLGNHDYQGNKAQIELDYAKAHPESRWKLPARWYRVNIPSDKPLVSLFMLDSTKDKFGAGEWEAQRAWLERELGDTPSDVWKVAVAHHPLFSNGSHGDNGVLETDWGALFKKFGLDFYVCGHDHDLQHLEIPGWSQSFVLVGGGGAGTRDMRRDNRGPFSRKVFGFGHFEFTPEMATVRLVGIDGESLHVFERAKAGAVKVIDNSPSDKATTKPLKEIQGAGKNKADD